MAEGHQNEASEIARFLKKLRSNEFRQTVEDWAQDVLNTAEAACGGVLGEGFEHYVDQWPASLDLGYQHYGHGFPEQIFSEAVDGLASPPIITVEELSGAFEVHLQESDQRIYGDFDSLYECFPDYVSVRILADRKSRVYELCEVRDLSDSRLPQDLQFALNIGKALGRAEILGTAPEIPQPEGQSQSTPAVGAEDEFTLWRGNGLKLTAEIHYSGSLRSLSQNRELPARGSLTGQISGRISEKAAAGVADDLIPCIRSALHSVALLRPSSRAMAIAGYTELNFDELRDCWPFIVACASLVFLAATKKDTMKRRFSNAVRLLSEADRQTSDAVKLALSVTALEALLGKKGSEIAGNLADGIAVLLEPDPSHRAAASEFVKKLYDARSRVLHGDSVDDAGVPVEAARTLAAGCLYGLCFRDGLRHRLGDDPDAPEALLAELRREKWAPTNLGGVPVIAAVRQLWGVSQPAE